MQDLVMDVTRLLSRGLEKKLPTGVDRVSLEYVRHFGDRAKALVRYRGRWIELRETASRRVFEALLAPDPELAKIIRGCVAREFWRGWSVRKHGVLLNMGHSGLDDADYVVQLQRREMRPFFFLHDLIPLTYPEYCRAGEAKRHLRRLQTMLSMGHGLIVNSIDTRNEVERFALAQGFGTPAIAVAPLAPAAMMPVTLERPLDAPYFVMLGTIEPRKNHLMVLQVWRQLVEELGIRAPHLVIIGQRGWECEQVVDLLERSAVLKKHVHEYGTCDDASLARWLSHAQALLFPSFAEGFGMPIVEALVLGVPVLASNLRVFEEIAGSIPDYLDPVDGLGWRSAVQDYMQPNSQARLAQLERLKHFEAPTWAQHFDVVESLLEQVTHRTVRP